MTAPIKYFLYARKSTDEKNRQVMSLDSQTNQWREVVKREHIFLHETLEESRSAKLPGRPVFDEMLDRIERGEANGILCWDIDRLYRNPVDEGRVRWLLQNGVIASIRTPTRQFIPEDAGLLMGVEGGRATDYIIRLARNVKRGVQEKLSRGEWPGATKPLGYMYDSRLRNIVPDPKRAKITQTIFEEYAAGHHSLNSVSKRLFEFGVKSRSGQYWSKWSVWQLLTNRLYIGIMDWNGETFEGKYKPLVPPEIFNRVQEVLKIKSKPRKGRKGHNFPFCGVFRCSCGSMMTAQWAKGHGGLYRYYRCTRKNGPCAEPYVQEHQVKQQCLDTLKPLVLTGDEAREIYAAIDREAAKESQSLDTTIMALEKKLSPLQNKLDRLTHGYLDQLIDEDSYRTAKEELVVEKTALKRETERLRRSRSSYWIEPTREVINTLETLGKSEFPESLPEISRLVQKIGTNPLISRKTVSFSFSEPYDFTLSFLRNVRVELAANPSLHSDKNWWSTTWCAREDLNLHPLRDQILSLACLPFHHSRARPTMPLPGPGLKPVLWVACADTAGILQRSG
jgi:site-specific DNA recombinase